jgi:NADPH-dependent 2,4-dienoyl-CoA reductase/sulfur reductase-like enzyme
MSTVDRVVIVGGGLAGAKAAEALREQGYDGTLTLVGAEDELPYQRPPLSKGYLAGTEPWEKALVLTREWYAAHDVELRLGCRASGIDPAAHQVLLADETSLGYDRLVLATGSTPRTLPVPGATASGVHTLRDRADSEAIRSLFGTGRRLVVIGAGWIGLEVAAAARSTGTDVTVIETADLPLLRVLGPEIAEVFADLHREHGVDLRLGTVPSEILVDDGRATGVRLGDGEVVEADGVVVGVGVVPNMSLAEAAGLAVDGGVLVDASLRTSDPDIYAVGDIAAHDHPVLGRRVRLEHWAGAFHQPATVAASILGEAATYRELPYFYTDQYDLGMEYVGDAPPGSYDRVVVRGDLGSREFVAFWLDADDHVIAAMNVNVWDVPDQVKPLIAERRTVDVARLTDPGVPLSEL